MDWIKKSESTWLGIIDRINPSSWNDRDKEDKKMKGKTDIVRIYKMDYSSSPRKTFKGGKCIDVYCEYQILYNIQHFPKQVISSVKELDDDFKSSYFNKYIANATFEDAKELVVDTIKNYTKELNRRI